MPLKHQAGNPSRHKAEASLPRVVITLETLLTRDGKTVVKGPKDFAEAAIEAHKAAPQNGQTLVRVRTHRTRMVEHFGFGHHRTTGQRLVRRFIFE